MPGEGVFKSPCWRNFDGSKHFSGLGEWPGIGWVQEGKVVQSTSAEGFVWVKHQGFGVGRRNRRVEVSEQIGWREI